VRLPPPWQSKDAAAAPDFLSLEISDGLKQRQQNQEADQSSNPHGVPHLLQHSPPDVLGLFEVDKNFAVL